MFPARKVLVLALSALFTLPAQAAVTAEHETGNIGSSGDADDPAV